MVAAMLASLFFGADYLEHATLRDGTEVVLRLVRPDDKELLRAGFARLSPESRYRRFFAVKTELSADELRYLTELDQVGHLAIGTTTADGGEGVGVARFIALPDEPGLAEAAIAVADEIQGRGLGSLLFQRLVAAARERGIERFRCEMLGSNQGMAELVRHLAPTASCEVESGVMRMEFTLPGLEPRHPASEPPRETGMYQLLSMIARGAIDWRGRWQGLGDWLRLGGRGEIVPGAGDAARTAAAEAVQRVIDSGGSPIETAAAAIEDPELDEPA